MFVIMENIMKCPVFTDISEKCSASNFRVKKPSDCEAVPSG